MFSRDLVEAMDNHTNNGVFSSSVILLPDDALDKDWKNTSGGYSGNGIATITLHNVFEPNITDPNKSTAQYIFDKYTKGRDENGNIPSGDVFPGDLNDPRNLSLVDDDRIAYFKEWNVWHNYIIWGRLNVVQSSTRPTTANVMVNRNSKGRAMESKNTENGKTEVRIMYNYEIVSFGYNENMPSQAIHALNSTIARKKNATNEVLTLKFEVSFIDDHPDDSDVKIAANHKIWLRVDYDRKTVLEQFFQALLIVLYVAAAVVVALVSWGIATAPAMVALSNILVMMIMVVELAEFARDLVHKLFNSWDENLARKVTTLSYEAFVTYTIQWEKVSIKSIIGNDVWSWPKWQTGDRYTSGKLKPGAVPSHPVLVGLVGSVTAALYLYEAYTLMRDFPQVAVLKSYQKWVSGTIVTPSYPVM
jgi:hypothetical protein